MNNQRAEIFRLVRKHMDATSTEEKEQIMKAIRRLLWPEIGLEYVDRDDPEVVWRYSVERRVLNKCT